MGNYIGIDIGGTKMYMLAQLQDGKMLEKQVPTGQNVTISYLRHEIAEFINATGAKPDGVGIAVPGLVENNTLLVSDVLPHLKHVSHTHFLHEWDCFLINDVRSATLFETSSMTSADTAIVIMVGTGIACGLFSNGKIITGCNGFAGELGSIKMTHSGGELRTLDELASGAAILRAAGFPIAEVLQKLTIKDEFVSRIIEDASSYLGQAIANLIHIFNPNKIILGGSTVTYTGYFKNMLATIHQHTLPELRIHCDISMTNNLKDIVALGAILHSKQSKFL